ncbi:MAG: T9SS type B sorting domain-containing protein [Chitinophagales bacterium]|nr:T9SS type B sorting domain-containing protein [Chitinophagales bacterium]
MVKVLKYSFIIAFLLLFEIFPANATHIVGGVVNYRHVSGNTYTITLRVYRDCFFGQAPFDNPAIIGVYDDNNNFVSSLSFSNPIVSAVNPPINNPCLIIPPNICVEEGRYVGSFTAPNPNMGYHLVYQRCCRNNTISNINLPVGATYNAYIPPTSVYANSNPVFNIFPPLFICVNAPLVFNHSATDPDGDSLVYELCTPFQGGDTMNPVPNPPAPPPFPNVVFQPPFTQNNPLGSTVPLAININSGVLTGTPDFTGQFVVGVCVSEYRNGVFLSQTIRDFQFNVTTCNIPTANIPSTNIDPNTQIGDFIELCEDNTTVKFNHQSSGAVSYEWHFGDPTTTADVSTLQSPTWDYPLVPGNYLVTLIAINDVGCVDTARANVIVHPLPNVSLTNDTTICPNSQIQLSASGGVKYQWSPANLFSDPKLPNPIASPGFNNGNPVKIDVFVTDVNGCTSSDSMFIDFHPLPDIDAGMDTSVCLEPNSFRDSVQLQATGGVSYTWTPLSGLNDSTVSNPIARPPTNMTYHVTGVDLNGCSASDSVLVYFLDPKLDIISVEIEEICINDSTQLVVLDQGTITSYSWSPNFMLSDPNEREPIFYPNTTTDYILTISNYCYVKDDTVEIIVHPLPLANAGNLDSVCIGDTIQLNASGGIMYSWQYSPSLSDTSIANPFAFPTDTSKYYITVTDINGCIASDSVTVLVHQLPTPNTYTDDPRKYICFGQSVILRSEGGVQYNWNFSETLTTLFGDSTIATPLDTTMYIVKVTNKHSCKVKDSVVVNVQKPITPKGDSLFDICVGLNITPTVTGGLYYQWTPSDYLSFSNIPNPIITPQASIVYRVYISNDCFRDSLDIDVKVRELPDADAGPSMSTFRGIPVTLNGSGGGDYLWTPAEDLDDPLIANPTASPLWTTTYSLRVTNEYGCVDFDSLILTVNSKDLLLVPTGFTPDGDGMNDYFGILQHLNVEKLLEFKVFNRWGEVVFEGFDMDDEWNGRYKGKDQEMGTYIFLVRYRNFDGDILVERGNVTLLR